MIRKTLASLCAAALILPATSALADSEPTFELWMASEDGSSSYAMVNEQNSKTVVAEIKDGKSSVLTGSKAQQAMETLKEKQPEQDIIRLEGGNVQVFSKTISEDDVTIIDVDEAGNVEIEALVDGERITLDESDAKGKKVFVKKIERSADGEEELSDAEVRKMLKEEGVEWKEDGNKTVIVKKVELSADTEGELSEEEIRKMLKEEGIDWESDGKKKVIIKKRVDSSTSTEETAETDGEVRKKVRVMKLSDMPEGMKPGADGDVKMRKSQKHVYNYSFSDDESGKNSSFIQIKGASAEEAAEFIDDIEDISDREKRRMKEALSI